MENTSPHSNNSAPNSSQSAFQSPEEQKIRPLSPQSLRIVPDIVRLFYTAYTNVPLYPMGSKVVTKVLDDLYQLLSDALSRDGELVFLNMKNRVVVNGQPLKERGLKIPFEEPFLKIFDHFNLQSLSVKSGLDKAEMTACLWLLSQDLSGGTTLADAFKNRGVLHIVADEVRYGILSNQSRQPDEEDVIALDFVVNKVLAWPSAENAAETLEIQSKEIAQTLTQLSEGVSYDPSQGKIDKDAQAKVVIGLLRKIGSQLLEKDPANWRRYQQGLAKVFFYLNNELRSKIFFGVKSPTDEDFIWRLAQEFSREDIVFIFCESYGGQEVSTEQLRNAVRRLLTKVVPGQEAALAVKESLLSAGLPPSEAKWIFEEGVFHALTTEEKIQKILGASLEDYIFMHKEFDIGAFADGLLKEKKEDALAAVLNRWKEHCRQSSAKVKQVLAWDVVRLVESLSDGDEAAGEILSDCAAEMMAEQSGEFSFQEFSRSLSDTLTKLIDAKKFKIASQIYRKFKDKEDSISVNKEIIHRIKQFFVSVFSQERLRFIAEEHIKGAGRGVNDSSALILIVAIAGDIVPVLLEAAVSDEATLKALGYFNVFMRRRVIGEALSEIVKEKGIEIVWPHFLTRLQSPKWFVIKNTTELIADIRDEKFVDLLEYPLKHNDVRVRRKAVFVLGKLGGGKSVFLLNRALENNIGEVQLDIISVLSRIGDVRSLDALKNVSGKGVPKAAQDAIEAIRLRLGGPEKKE